jgi:cobalt-zinc-cadmium efflux system protein
MAKPTTEASPLAEPSHRAAAGHEHPAGHGHAHGLPDYSRAFAIGVALNLGFVIAEAGYGVVAHSLALLADAGHNLSDVFGLLLAWGASVLVRRGPSRKYTYGLKGSSILASLASAVMLLVAIGAIAWEAAQRFFHSQPVAGGTVMLVAGIGILVNGATALLFASGRKGDINIRGAYLHMAADAAVSLGVVIAGLAITLTGWLWLDPLVSLAIVGIIVANTWGLLKESLDLALHAVPAGTDPAAVQAYLAGLPGIAAVHDLHIWGMSTTESALTVHLVTRSTELDNALLASIARDLHDKFGIEHPTIQLERADQDVCCHLAPDDVV